MGSTENGDLECGSHPAGTEVGNTNGLLKWSIVSSTQEMCKDEGFLLVVKAYQESNRRSQEFYAYLLPWKFLWEHFRLR